MSRVGRGKKLRPRVARVLDSIFSSPRTSGMPRVLECFTTLFVRFDPIWPPPHFVIASTVQGCWGVAPDFLQVLRRRDPVSKAFC